jgi:hypothetical protein
VDWHSFEQLHQGYNSVDTSGFLLIRADEVA